MGGGGKLNDRGCGIRRGSWGGEGRGCDSDSSVGGGSDGDLT